MTIERADAPQVFQQAPDWVSLARDAFTSSTHYFDANIRHQVEADLRQSQGLHPLGSKYLADKSRSRLFRPKTRATIRKNEAAAAEAFFTTNDVVSIKPEDDNDEVQAASAAIMGELLQYRLTKTIPWYQLLIGAYQDAQTVGVVASYQYWEYNQKKGIDRPAIRLVPIENIRFDPGASWTDPVGTSPYLIEMIPMYVGQVTARMRAVDPKTGEAKWKAYPDSVILGASKMYGDSIRLARENQRTDSKTNQQATSAYNIVWIHKNIVEIDEVDYVYYTLGCEHLLSEPVPLDSVYFHGRRPYVIGTSILETHKLYPSSLPKLTHDVQAEINEVTNQRIDNVKLALNKRYFARRNKQVDLRSVTRNVPGSVTLMQDTDDVKVVEFGDVTQSSYKEQEMLNLDFDDVAGAFSNASVQSNRKLNETVGGMNLLSTSAGQVSNYQLRTFVETWVEPVLRQLVLLEQHYETDETLLGLCGRSAQVFQRFGINAVTDTLLLQEFTLNVNVGMGATNPATQVQQFIQGMTSLRDMVADGTLMNMGLDVKEAIKEIFGKLGYKDGGRFFKNEDDQDPTIKRLQDQIQQLQQQLDAKMPPEILQATVKKLLAEAEKVQADTKGVQAQAVKTMVEAQYSAMQGAEVVAAVPAVAPIADRLMQNGGYQMPNPPGVDPNLPQPPAPATGLAVQDVTNKRTGVGFMPGGGASTTDLPPQQPQPATPGMGERRGIETQRLDGVNGYADGGLIDDPLSPYPPQQFGSHIASAAMSALDAGKITPQQAGAYRERARSIANPNWPDTGAFGSTMRLFGGAGTGNTTDEFTGPGNVIGEFGGKGVGSSMDEFYGRGSILSNFADGGLIQGPGTGTSDSIPALAAGKPAAVSNGEFLVPKQVVDALGVDFFEKLIEQYHTEVPQNGQPQPATNLPPLFMENGSMVIPADVVQTVGADFFHKLVELYGGQTA